MKKIWVPLLLVSCLLAACGPTMKVGSKIEWHGQEFLVVEPLPKGTPVKCHLGSLTVDGATYAVCTAPRRLVFHYGFLVLQNASGSWVAVALGEH